MNQNAKTDRAARISALKQIYRLYDDYTADLSLACEKYCADCCTTNVTLTGLEGELILSSVDAEQRNGLLNAVDANRCAERFQPSLTTNHYAALCRSGQEPPDEQCPPDAGACPLLANEACTIYALRPFGCRCMVSARICRDQGCARVDDYTLTVNTVFLQFIEHLDKGGVFGNFTDVMLRIDQGDKNTSECKIVSNHPIAMLMVPPEHQGRIRPLLDQLSRIISGLE